MKSKQKTIIQRQKPIWDGAHLFLQENPKVAHCIMDWCVKQIYSQFSQNKDSFTPNEKSEFESMVKELKQFKQQLATENLKCTKEEFSEFLENLFANVDDIDRNGEVTLKTSMIFKLVSDLIEPLVQFEPIPDVWKKKRKTTNY